MPRREYERRLVERLHYTRRWENEMVPLGVTIADLDADEIPTLCRDFCRDLDSLANHLVPCCSPLS